MKKYFIFTLFLIHHSFAVSASSDKAETEAVCEEARVKVSDMNRRKQDISITGKLVETYRSAKYEMSKENYAEAKRLCQIIKKYAT